MASHRVPPPLAPRSYVRPVRTVRRVVAAAVPHHTDVVHGRGRRVFAQVHVGLRQLLRVEPHQVAAAAAAAAGGTPLLDAVRRLPLERFPLSGRVAGSPGHRHQHHRLRGIRLALRQVSEAAAAAFRRVRVGVSAAANHGFAAAAAVRTL